MEVTPAYIGNKLNLVRGMRRTVYSAVLKLYPVKPRMSTIKNFVFIRLCRITIHVLQLNIEKAEILPLCYNFVTTTKQTAYP